MPDFEAETIELVVLIVHSWFGPGRLDILCQIVVNLINIYRVILISSRSSSSYASAYLRILWFIGYFRLIAISYSKCYIIERRINSIFLFVQNLRWMSIQCRLKMNVHLVLPVAIILRSIKHWFFCSHCTRTVHIRLQYFVELFFIFVQLEINLGLLRLRDMSICWLYMPHS